MSWIQIMIYAGCAIGAVFLIIGVRNFTFKVLSFIGKHAQ